MFPTFNRRIMTTVGVDSSIGCRTDRPSITKTVCKNEWLTTFFSGLVPFTNIWGILTAIVLGGVGVDLTFHRHRIGYYFIGGSAFVLIAEVTWVVTLFLRICVRNDNKLWNCWSTVTCFCHWKKSIVYVPMGTIPLVWPHNLWLSYVAGVLLLLLALLHFLLSFSNIRRKKKKKSRLLQTETDSFESSKFEEVTDCLDDSLPEPIPSSSQHNISDNLLDRSSDTILEI